MRASWDEVVAADELRDKAVERAAQLAEFDADTFSAMKQGLRGDGIAAVVAGLDEASKNGS